MDPSTLPASETVTISIPTTLYSRIEKVVITGAERNEGSATFKSVSDYITYVLREVVALHESKEMAAGEPFTHADVEEIKERLKALGYL